MNIHEYQAKKLFERFNVATPKGAPAETPEEAERVAAALNTSNLVVKAQIHAGGRGKGTFTNGFKGGVKLCTTPAEARELAEKMLGQTLVTHQLLLCRRQMLALNCLFLSFYRVLVPNPSGEAHQEWRREFALPRNRQIYRLAKRDSPVPPRTSRSSQHFQAHRLQNYAAAFALYDGQMAGPEAEPSPEDVRNLVHR
jgi:hypothetical protein